MGRHSRPHGHRRHAAVFNPEPAVLGVAARCRIVASPFSKGTEFISLDRFPRGDGINAQDARGVKTEDLILDLGRQLRIFMLRR